MLLVLNDGDPALDTAFSETFVKRLVAPDQLTVFRIPADAELGHDFVGHQASSGNYPHLDEAYGFLADALELEIPHPSPTK